MANIIRFGVAPVDPNTYLYNLGNLCTSLTGGWGTSYTVTGYTPILATLGTSSITASLSGSYKMAHRTTTNQINLTSYTSLKIECEFTTSGSGTSLTIMIDSDTSGENYAGYIQQTVSTSGKTIVTLDASSFNGSYYVIFYFSTASAPNTISGNITKAWLE